MIFAVVLFFLFGNINALTFKNGAYEELVFQIQDDVPFENCREVLLNLEMTINASSQYLFSALDGRAYIRSATILLPNSWPKECEPSKPQSSRGEKGDVFVTTKGQPVWTMQTLGCGQPGDAIYLNREALAKTVADENDTPLLARQFIREFAKYRYGVFDEHGFGSDEIYPVCYHDGEFGTKPKVSGCSTSPVQDNGMCSKPNSDFNSSLVSVDALARTSIMFDVTSPSVSMFCDEGNHDRYAPTKHNFMCDRRSTLDVILKHSDFLNSNTQIDVENRDQIKNTTPIITYTRKNITRYVLIVEDTQDISIRESWSYLRSAIGKWAFLDLKSNSEVSVVTVNESAANVLLRPTLLQTKDDRDVLASSLPYNPNTARGPGCIRCAIKEALSILEKSKVERGAENNVIVIVAPGIDQNTLPEIQKEIETANTKISTINYPGIKFGRAPLDSLSNLTGGQSYTIYEKKHNSQDTLLSTYFELINVFVDISAKNFMGSPAEIQVEIHRRELINDDRTSITGSFILDENLSEPARFALYTHSSKNILIKEIHLWSPSQKEYSRRSDSLLGIKMITLSGAQINEPGTWTYRIDKYPGNPQPYYVQVTATPKRASAPIVSAELKMERPKPGNGPKALYVKVMKGFQPVMGARVEVTVKRIESNGTNVFTDKFEMRDMGGGDPDVTKGDGVYTKYWSASNAAGPGTYTFEVVVTDNGNTAYAAIPEGEENEGTCCGSSTKSASRVQPLQPFQRILPPLTVHFTQEDLENELKVSSGRIGDLKARVLSPERRVRLSWTSPDIGGLGTVRRYEVLFAKSVRDIVDNLETSAEEWTIGTPFLLAPNAETTFTLNFTSQMLGQVFYFAIKAFGPSEVQEALVSNWVRIFVPRPVPPTIPTGVPTTSGSSWPNYEVGLGEGDFTYGEDDNVIPAIAQNSDFNTTWARLGLPVAIGLVLLLLVITAYCYYCVARKRGRDAAKKPVNSSNGTKGDKLQSAITIVPSSPTHVATPVAQPHNMENGHYNNQHAYTNELQLQQHLEGDIGVPAYTYDDEPKKRYSLIQHPGDQQQQLIEELKQQQQYGVAIISNDGRTLSPYESWSASQLLHEHEIRRHSPNGDEQMMHHQLMQQGTVDHYGVIIPPPVPPLPAYGSQNVYGSTIYGTQPVLPAYHPQPPPQFNVSLQGSMSSVNSAEKKRRNVTMV